MDDEHEHDESCGVVRYVRAAPVRLHWTDPLRTLLTFGARVAEAVASALEDSELDLAAHARWSLERREFEQMRAAAMVDMGLIDTTPREIR